MMKKIFDAVKIYRSFWQKFYDKLCHHLGGVGAYLFIAFILVFLMVQLVFFSFILSQFLEKRNAIEQASVVISSIFIVPLVDLPFKAALYMVERMRSFIDRMKGL